MNILAEHPKSQAQRRRGLELSAAIVAFTAFGGAVGLVTGWLSVGAELNARLPLHSPVLGGIALAVIVGVPFAALARQARRGDERSDETSRFAGAVLVGWLLVELAFIREFSFFHPTYGAIGIAFVVAGRRRR